MTFDEIEKVKWDAVREVAKYPMRSLNENSLGKILSRVIPMDGNWQILITKRKWWRLWDKKFRVDIYYAKPRDPAIISVNFTIE